MALYATGRTSVVVQLPPPRAVNRQVIVPTPTWPLNSTSTSLSFAGAITGQSNANPAVLTTAVTIPSGGTFSVTVAGYTGLWVAANGTWAGIALTANTFAIPVNSTSLGVATGSPTFSFSTTVHFGYGVIGYCPRESFNFDYAPAWDPTLAFPNGKVGVLYGPGNTFDLAPALSPTTFTLFNGALPPGLSITNLSGDQGSLTGTPTTVGTYLFRLLATNTLGTAISQMFTIQVMAGKISILDTVLPPATLGVAYSQTLSVGGGVAPYTFSLASGSLPPGLTLSSGGVISGTATGSALLYTFAAQATDSEGISGIQGFTLSTVVATGGSVYGYVG